MKQDIRNLFKNEDDRTVQKLPFNHSNEFQKKLQSLHTKTKTIYILKIAAVILVFMSVGFALFNIKPSNPDNFNNISQIDIIEKKYIEDIESEWENFIKITTDTTLIKRFDKKLAELQNDYKILSEQQKSHPDNILTIEELIKNLETRLKLLQDIQTHIQRLNENNANHETI